MLDGEDFNLGYNWKDDGRVLYIDHLWLDPEHRGNGSYILETLVRVACYEGAEVVEVSIGGGERAEAFLKKNGFHVLRRRYYSDDTLDHLEEDYEYGIDAVRKI